MKLKYFLAASALSLTAGVVLPAPVAAQETTASLRGDVTDRNGNPVAGATVRVRHVPSGTEVTQTTGADGTFSAVGLRLGGPFAVSVAAPGFESAQQEIGFLTAGQAQRVAVVLANAGDRIVVSSARQRSAITISTGAATVLDASEIAGVSNVNRDIRNLAARDPLVSLDPTNGGAISIAGQNNRYNRFTVDGVAFGDPFGLESGGLVSTRGPVPLDAIGEFSVEAAPVDIQQGFFQGGAINTQLRSGGNNFTFLAGGYYADDSLRGTRAGDQTRTGEYQSEIYTAQVTGPIIPNTLFFAVTYERLRDTVPALLSPSSLGITDAQLTQITDIADNVYNFDTQGVATDIAEKDDKLVVKLDLNVASGHRVAATYIYNEGNVLAGQTPTSQLNATNPNFQFLSNNYNQGAVNHFGILQFNDQWTDTFSTQLRVSYADYVRLQQPFGDASFGEFRTCLADVSTAAPQTCPTGTRQLTFGPDISRQANELESQSLAVEFLARLRMGDHELKFIAERRQQDVRNLFAQRVSGAWYFDSIADLQARRANELDLAVPIRGGIDTVTADFQNNSLTLGLMDTWDVTDALTITAGLRFDRFDTPDTPFFNQDFVNRFGFGNDATLDARSLLQPRFGFNWQATDRLTVRGSAGLFGGGSPLVWISNNYSNPGPTLGRVQVRRAADGTFTISGISGLTNDQVQTIGAATLNNVSGGTGVPQSLINAIRTTGSSSAPTNALDPDFEVPSQWRVSGTLEYAADFGSLGDDWNFGVDVIWSRTVNALEWTDLRTVEATGTLPDGRQRYTILPGQTGTNTDLLLTNTDQGYSWNVVARFDKAWDFGLTLGGSYTFQRSEGRNAGTSSVAFSNYTNSAAEDPNFSAYGTANYQRDDALRLSLDYDTQLFGDNNTHVGLFFTSTSGQHYSYTFADQASGSNRSAVFGTVGTNSRYLMYVPDVSSATADPLVTYASGFDFAGFQSFIQGSELAEYQGQIAPLNLGESPRYNKLDLSLRQEVPLPAGGRFELLLDMENVLNFIDSDWGVLRQVAFPYYAPLVNVTCSNAACDQYVYSNRSGSTFTPPAEAVNLTGSLWSLRLGARVRF